MPQTKSWKVQLAELFLVAIPMLLIGALSLWFLSQRPKMQAEQEEAETAAVGGAAGRRPTNSEMREARRKERERAAAEAAAEAAAAEDGEEGEQGGGAEDGGANVGPAGGGMKKLSAKEMKKEMRAFQEQQRKAKDEKDAKRAASRCVRPQASGRWRCMHQPLRRLTGLPC